MKNKISKKLSELMIEKDITQTELAMNIGVSIAAISYWIKGKKEATADNIISLADYFEVSTDYLLGRSNEIGIIATNTNLSSDEQHIVDCFRALSKDGQKSFVQMAESILRAHNISVPIRKII